MSENFNEQPIGEDMPFFIPPSFERVERDALGAYAGAEQPTDSATQLGNAALTQTIALSPEARQTHRAKLEHLWMQAFESGDDANADYFQDQLEQLQSLDPDHDNPSQQAE